MWLCYEATLIFSWISVSISASELSCLLNLLTCWSPYSQPMVTIRRITVKSQNDLLMLIRIAYDGTYYVTAQTTYPIKSLQPKSKVPIRREHKIVVEYLTQMQLNECNQLFFRPFLNRMIKMILFWSNFPVWLSFFLGFDLKLNYALFLSAKKYTQLIYIRTHIQITNI